MSFLGFSGPRMTAVGNPTTVYTTEIVPLGTTAVDNDGNEYIFLEGVADVVAGDWVTYDGDYLAARLAANAVGQVAIFLAAVVASSYGWACRKGRFAGANADAVAANTALYIDATAGRVDDDVVAGDLVANAFAAAAAAANKVTVDINYPFVTNTLS
jgi:hypothetical protein